MFANKDTQSTPQNKESTYFFKNTPKKGGKKGKMFRKFN